MLTIPLLPFRYNAAYFGFAFMTHQHEAALRRMVAMAETERDWSLLHRINWIAQNLRPNDQAVLQDILRERAVAAENQDPWRRAALALVRKKAGLGEGRWPAASPMICKFLMTASMVFSSARKAALSMPLR